MLEALSCRLDAVAPAVPPDARARSRFRRDKRPGPPVCRRCAAGRAGQPLRPLVGCGGDAALALLDAAAEAASR